MKDSHIKTIKINMPAALLKNIIGKGIDKGKNRFIQTINEKLKPR